jgi:Tol biopolymer transport system component
MGDVYFAEYENGQYKKPVNLGPAINTDQMEGTPFISPDGGYLIFQRSLDLFISFRREDGSWLEAKSLGPQINTPSYELCPIVTHDGKYLFFNSGRSGEIHTWWVDAGIIDKLRSQISPNK